MNIDTVTRNEAVSNVTEPEKGYRLSIGRNIIRVVSVFNGTKTASEAIHEAAVKKILFDRTAG
nr:hypothetical protein [uncultured Acetatifactor sp.]